MQHLVLGLLSTTEQTGSPGGDETGFLTLGSLARDGRSFTDMLVVTTTVRMVDGVHGNTTSLGPRVALDSELVLGTGSLEERLVRPSTTSNDADHAAHRALDHLLRTAGKLDPRLALIGVVANDGDVVAGSPAQSTTVAHLLLHVRDDGTLRDGAEREDVADGEGGVLAGVDELSGVHALVRDESLGVQLVAVRVTELDFGERSTTAGIVDDILDYTANVAMALSEIVGTELRGGLVESCVRSEDRATALPLVADDTTHLACL